MTTAKKTVHSELARIQQGLHVPKDQRNNFGKYMYRNFEDICKAVKPLLGDCTLTASDSIRHIGDRYYVEAELTLTLSGEAVQVTACARETEDRKGMDDSQITGTASSYARKYAANGMFLLDDTKDADTDEYNNESKATKPAPKPKPKKAPEPAQQEAEMPSILPEDDKATKKEVLEKIQTSKSGVHIGNIYRKHENQARAEHWLDEMIAECSRCKMALQMEAK